LLRPAFARTLRPGASTVPRPLLLIDVMERSSITITAWVLLMIVLVLCRKSLRIRATFACSSSMRAFCFLQFRLNFIFRASFRCSRASLFSFFRKELTGANVSPVESVANFATPTSTPAMLFAGWTGISISCSAWMEMNQCPPARETVSCIGVPATPRLLR
jgi:hypothetical protein